MGVAPDLVAHAAADIKMVRPSLAVRIMGEMSDHILDVLAAGKFELAVGRFSTPRHRQLFSFKLLAEDPQTPAPDRDDPNL